MNGKTIIIEKQSGYGMHEEHLYYIVPQGFHLTDGQSYLALVTEPRFCCDHCGRQAVSERNLCVPIEL